MPVDHPPPHVHVPTARPGDARRLGALLELVYDDLRRQARRLLQGERVGHSLQPTALVHEAYLRLLKSKKLQPAGRCEFLGLASLCMRRILVEAARKRRRRGAPVPLLEIAGRPGLDALDILDVDAALRFLTIERPRAARVVEMRFFGGLQNQEIAEILDVDVQTVMRDWKAGRLLLLSKLNERDGA